MMVLSLLLCMAVAVMWIRSYGPVADVWYFPPFSTRHYVESWGGNLCFGWHRLDRANAFESICIPHVIPLAMLVVLPAITLVLRLRHRNVRIEGFDVIRQTKGPGQS